MKTKKCIIIHGCPSNEKDLTFNKHWIPWTKKKLIENRIEIKTPIMPSPWRPDYEEFKKEFEKQGLDENTILVGHSCGCAFLVRWLGETKNRILKLILVAPWKIPDKDDELTKDFYQYPIDKTIKDRVKETIIFTSDNEYEDGKKSVKIFHKALGGEVIELKSRGHYIMRHMGTEEFPELLDVILK